MKPTQHIKTWTWNETQIDFDRFIQNFIDDTDRYGNHHYIVATTITNYLDGVAMEGFIIYEDQK